MEDNVQNDIDESGEIVHAEFTPEAMPDPDEDALVLKAQQGDVHAFDQLVERYQSKIYGLVYNMTSNREDAEDLVQEVFVKAYRALPRFKGNLPSIRGSTALRSIRPLTTVKSAIASVP